MIASAISTDQLADLVARHIAEHATTPWGTTLQHLALWSPGLLILIGLYFLVRRPPEFVAMLIAAIQSQATSVQRLSIAVEESTRKDDYQQREILGLLQVMGEDVRDVKRELRAHIAGPPKASQAETSDG